jgi:enamine deaminase RidA (YjgF/YER057c/UK114 family)
VANSTLMRRFAGPAADEFSFLSRPQAHPKDTVRQAEAAYRALATSLADIQASFLDLIAETLLLRDVRRDLPCVLDVRARVLAELGQRDSAPLPAVIGQAPIDAAASFELSAWAVVPRDRNGWSVQDVRAVPTCACDGCARSGARLVRLGPQLTFQTTNLYGAGADAYEQSWEMFRAAERLLQQGGMSFRDVARTWIHLRDIDRDYDALNRARREFFRDRGIEQRPASTGVEGSPFPVGHDVSLSLQALESPSGIDITRMSTPTLNEAWNYGADFSRGLRLVEANKVTLHISGTASIDERGRSVHTGDFDAQADRMLDNIEGLLAQQGASVANLVSGITYLKHSGDAPRLQEKFRQRGFETFPCAIVQASLCRPELLCETEAVALLPRATSERRQ